VSTLSRVKALSALFSFLLQNPNWLSNLHIAGDIARLEELYATLVLFVTNDGCAQNPRKRTVVLRHGIKRERNDDGPHHRREQPDRGKGKH
jgi:hypothetical protein